MKKSGDTYRPSVPDRPTHHTPRVTSGTDFQWKDLSRVQPRHCQPRRSENSGEQEHEEDGCATHARSVSTASFRVDRSTGETTGAEHADALADGAPVESPATTDPIESEDANQGGEHVGDIVETGNPETT